MSRIILSGQSAGILPPYLLLELGKRTGKPCYLETLAATLRRQEAVCQRRARLFDNRSAGAGASLIEIYDCHGREERPGTRARFEGEAPVQDADIDNAYEFSRAVRNYYLEVHGRNGIDARGMKMISSVKFGSGYNNAFWDGEQMTYGTGDRDIFASFVLLDICGHEITHGVSEFESGLKYWRQAGALNESHSDVFGKMIEAHAKDQTVDQIDWVLGRGVFMPEIEGEGIRNMLHPGTAYDDPRLGKDPQPDCMSKYIEMSFDNGGVHYNSGIVNRAFALFVVSLSGYEWKKAARVWFAARALSGANPSFANHAYYTLAAAKTLGTAADLKKLKAAWDAVEIRPSKKVSKPDPYGDDGE
jgi:Zn-dependent metalloprotease